MLSRRNWIKHEYCFEFSIGKAIILVPCFGWIGTGLQYSYWIHGFTNFQVSGYWEQRGY